MRGFVFREKRLLLLVVLVTGVIYFAFFHSSGGAAPARTSPPNPAGPKGSPPVLPPPAGKKKPVERSVSELVARSPCSSKVSWGTCHSDSEAKARQLAYLTDTNSLSCDRTGVCRCHRDDEIFFGQRCIPRGEWTAPYEVLRKKWHEVPVRTEIYEGGNVVGGDGFISSTRDMLKFTDEQLKKTWLSVRPVGDCLTDFFVSQLKGKKVLDIGAGFARQSLQVALGGADVTFLDVVPTNLQVIERLCKIFDIADRCKFIYLETLDSLSALEDYDGMLAFGTQHHMPREFIVEQFKIVLPHLNPGGTWWQLAYPVNRWGSDFHVFGQQTDGAATPWAEWYEPGKLLTVMGEAGVAMEMDWCGIINTSEFIWFGLHRV